ncbi:hypothetical protein M422DRAFT_252929 [Sphaerobolus stellatus SS14]|uniref:Uncharacterized protein n=1 Tax=Sphaerobolus stellatus (strain SS14) TaxID=990650 RepID=A0A0C9VNR0_SPHS4|nr:hypothetical protein M422DRAFT_252929 [Sphaerobolus stellatus SS14]
MSIPNAIRDHDNHYFLKENAFMHQMKAVFGSHLNFESIFSGFSSNSLTPHQQMRWITDVSTPIRVGSQIIKGCKDNSQVPAPIYNQIIPYMERDGEKRPRSTAGVERAAYMQLHQSVPAPTKGKKPLTGSSQSKSSAHTSQAAKIGQSSLQWLDANLDDYNQQCEPPLPYNDEPPTGEPDVEMSAPTHVGASGTLPDESAMNLDHELDDLND